MKKCLNFINKCLKFTIGAVSGLSVFAFIGGPLKFMRLFMIALRDAFEVYLFEFLKKMGFEPTKKSPHKIYGDKRLVTPVFEALNCLKSLISDVDVHCSRLYSKSANWMGLRSGSNTPLSKQKRKDLVAIKKKFSDNKAVISAEGIKLLKKPAAIVKIPENRGGNPEDLLNPKLMHQSLQERKDRCRESKEEGLRILSELHKSIAKTSP